MALIEVEFKGNRKEFFLWDGEEVPAVKAAVIVDADRGEDLGFVHAVGALAEQRNAGTAHGYGTALPTKKARRLGTQDDVRRLEDVRGQDEDARRRAMERVRANDLVMKISDAEWQWDRKKLTFYFTADKRVDFRNLVRELASMFRTRIELKQIGVRDEAKRLDGIGRCGRQYCSSSWLPELRPVNLGVAKDQRLSLNPSQISGACGRLMCCLRYEHEFYVQSRKRFPKEGKIIRTTRGEEKVVANDIFRERVTLRNVEGEVRVIALADLRAEVDGAAQTTGADLPTTTDSAPAPRPQGKGSPAARRNRTEDAEAEDADLSEADELDEQDSALLDEDEPSTRDFSLSTAPGSPTAGTSAPPRTVTPAAPPAETPEDTGDESSDVPRKPHRRRGRRGGRRNRGGARSAPRDGAHGGDDAPSGD
jgi:cell fate regulator YaaT (PSP1 superfamily)